MDEWETGFVDGFRHAIRELEDLQETQPVTSVDEARAWLEELEPTLVIPHFHQ